MKNLSEKALLVNLKINQWVGRKYDKQISKQVEQDHNAYNAGRYDKILITDDTLKEVQRVANSARNFLYENTLPWSDSGDRLLPATNYLEFTGQIRNLKHQFEQTVNEFIIQYPDLKRKARSRLNGMFREADYPDITDLRNKFSLEINFMPVSDLSDFRLQVDEEEADSLRGQIEKEMNSRIIQATMNIWSRIKEAVSHMVEKLSEKDAIFRDSLVENIRELIEILPRLNFTQDNDINNVIENMKVLLVSPEQLRNDTRLRNTKAKEAKAILDKVNDFF